MQTLAEILQFNWNEFVSVLSDMVKFFLTMCIVWVSSLCQQDEDSVCWSPVRCGGSCQSLSALFCLNIDRGGCRGTHTPIVISLGRAARPIDKRRLDLKKTNTGQGKMCFIQGELSLLLVLSSTLVGEDFSRKWSFLVHAYLCFLHWNRVKS